MTTHHSEIIRRRWAAGHARTQATALHDTLRDLRRLRQAVSDYLAGKIDREELRRQTDEPGSD